MSSSLSAADSRLPEMPDARRIAVTRLRLTNFRNYAGLTLGLDSRPVVLTGPNGSGKTNLLEAVSFLAPGRGLRRVKLETIARNGGDGSWAVAASLAGPGGTVEIGTGLVLSAEGPERGRRLLINHAPARSADSLLEYVRVLWLTPAMDGLFTGPASDRRRFLDRLVLTVDRRHSERVNAFEKAMRGRNRLLEDFSPNAAWLTAIETEMAEIGVAIAAARLEGVALLSRMIALAPTDPFPEATLALEGTLEDGLASGSATEVEDRYRSDLAAGRPADKAAGRTLSGPHLSDLRVGHRPKAAPAEICSTGEQKALLLGLVLAHAHLAKTLSGETPIILLDEVAAHLDADRREALFSALLRLGGQAWMTGTDASSFAPLGTSAQFFTVRDGSLASAV